MQPLSVWEVADRIGLPNDRNAHPSRGSCPWDGFQLCGAGERDLDADLWHEIGHALVAPDYGWKLHGWGQGMVYEGSPGGRLLFGAGEETDASAVGIWAQAVLGGDPDGAHKHAEEHSWDSPGPDSYLLRLDHPLLADTRWCERRDRVLGYLVLGRGRDNLYTGTWASVKKRVENRLVAAGLPSPWGVHRG